MESSPDFFLQSKGNKRPNFGVRTGLLPSSSQWDGRGLTPARPPKIGNFPGRHARQENWRCSQSCGTFNF
eukprot:334945-Pyramimonas_sp.AAC.2